jgi:hypothetical protein
MTMAGPPTSIRKLPPHRANQSHAAVTPAPVIKAEPPASPAPSPAPAIKTEPPASPTLSMRTTIPPHKRSAGPHARLGPHAQKPSAAPQMQPPNHHPAPSTVETHSPVSSQDVLVNLQSPKSAEKPTVVADPWVELEGLKVKTEPDTAGTDDPSVRVAIKSRSQVSEPATVVAQSSTPNEVVASAPDKRALAESTVVDSPGKVRSSLKVARKTHTDKIRQLSNGIHRFGRNEWLPMLFAMKDTEKGRQLIRAFTDHIRAGIDGSDTGNLTPSTQQELFMEFPDGSGLTAFVPLGTPVSQIVKDCADFVLADESEVSIVLKVRVEDHGN